MARMNHENEATNETSSEADSASFRFSACQRTIAVNSRKARGEAMDASKYKAVCRSRPASAVRMDCTEGLSLTALRVDLSAAG